MATTTVAGGDIVTILHIGRRGLDHYLRAVKGMAGNPRLKCDGRSLLLVSQGLSHERAAQQLDMMLLAVADVLAIPSRAYGSTFYRLPESQKGVIPDKSYYFQNVERVRKVPEIDLRSCPPPDLVIEVVVSHGPAHSLRVCRALRVPEVWIYDVPERRLRVLHLKERLEGSPRYVSGSHSLALPFLSEADIAPWAEATEDDDGEFARRLRAWARDQLAPRLGDVQGPGNA